MGVLQNNLFQTTAFAASCLLHYSGLSVAKSSSPYDAHFLCMLSNRVQNNGRWGFPLNFQEIPGTHHHGL